MCRCVRQGVVTTAYTFAHTLAAGCAYPGRCKTNSVGQSAGLSILRSSFRFRQNPKKTEISNLHGFELHRPSSKGNKLLFQVIKTIINQCTQECSSESTLAHDAVAAAVSHKHHLIIRVGAGLIQFVNGSHLKRGLTPSKIIFSPFFARDFMG